MNYHCNFCFRDENEEMVKHVQSANFLCDICDAAFSSERKLNAHTGKSLSEALIFASTNPQYDNRLLIELQVQYMKIPSSNVGRPYCV